MILIGRKCLEDFLSVVLADTEDMWHEKCNEYNKTYTEPKMTFPILGAPDTMDWEY